MSFSVPAMLNIIEAAAPVIHALVDSQSGSLRIEDIFPSPPEYHSQMGLLPATVLGRLADPVEEICTRYADDRTTLVAKIKEIESKHNPWCAHVLASNYLIYGSATLLRWQMRNWGCEKSMLSIQRANNQLRFKTYFYPEGLLGRLRSFLEQQGIASPNVRVLSFSRVHSEEGYIRVRNIRPTSDWEHWIEHPTKVFKKKMQYGLIEHKNYLYLRRKVLPHTAGNIRVIRRKELKANQVVPDVLVFEPAPREDYQLSRPEIDAILRANAPQ